MGHLLNPQTFVSDLSPSEIRECRRRVLEYAQHHFAYTSIESFDLGNLSVGYMTAEITTTRSRGQRRILYYVNKQLVFTQRHDAGQGVRRQAEAYYALCLKSERKQERERQAKPSAFPAYTSINEPLWSQP